ncbi:acyl carrier protein [Streptomyces sp. NPDC007205]|uniref:acyl carrier protein n=1 Tax=Streptomyces sp. NPDC007205 TaxID=3154316 RepID=UPI0033C5A1C2
MYEYLVDQLATTFKVDQAMAPDQSFKELGLDSLTIAEVGAALQEALGVEVAEEELTETTKLGALAALLEAKGAVVPGVQPQS